MKAMLVNATSPVTPDEKREALALVLNSRTFSRAEQLRSLLEYLCRAEAEGRQKELTEYVIGRDVLGRPEDYSPGEDSSVRTRAYELRHKLEKLYHLEARDAPIRIVLPKGTYIPQYERAPLPAPSESANLTEPLPGASVLLQEKAARPRWVWAVLALSAALAAAGLSLSMRAVSRAPQVDPIVSEAWGPLAKPDANVLISVATPLHLTVGPEGHKAYGSPTYPAPPEAYPIWRQYRPLPAGAKLGLVFTDNVLGFGTMNAVLQTTTTLRTMGVSYQVLPERVAPMSTFRGRNVILFGAPVDSDAVTRTHESLPLVVDYEPSVQEFVIRDRKSGRIKVPQKDAQGDFREVYGLITVLNNRESNQGKLGMVAFSGITSAGTQGAAEYFSSANALQDLEARFRRDGISGFPAAYQVVVKCTFGNKLLLSYECLEHQTLQR